METTESLDVFMNGVFLGVMEAKENATKESLIKPAEQFFPRRTITFKKIIHIPHRSITFIEKVI